jgi:hypothetical protein
VIFEDIPDTDSDETDSEAELPPLNLTEDEDRISITDLDEKPQEVVVPEVDALAELESKVEDSDLVLNP